MNYTFNAYTLIICLLPSFRHLMCGAHNCRASKYLIFVFFLSISPCQKQSHIIQMHSIYSHYNIWENIVFVTFSIWLLSNLLFCYGTRTIFLNDSAWHFCDAFCFIFHSNNICGWKILAMAKLNIIKFALVFTFTVLSENQKKNGMIFVVVIKQDKQMKKIFLQNLNQNVINSYQGQRIGIRIHSKCSYITTKCSLHFSIIKWETVIFLNIFIEYLSNFFFIKINHRQVLQLQKYLASAELCGLHPHAQTETTSIQLHSS